MKLRQAESLGVFYHHNRRVRNINPYFNDQGRNQNIQLVILKLLKCFLLLA